ncbi:MAG: DNA (cytosine-5-)-methyltransferase [Defluviitaleaceae bacterium]|nr:DNA (cytosine-5-)-methyltransferase [Defluviitaleaceae bacterium]
MLIKHLELFSGIGGFRQALELLCNDFDILSENIGFSELDANAISTYKSNFNTENEVEIGDIVSFVNTEGNIKSLPNFNFLTGGFPCQAFSMMGNQKGFGDLRGNVFFKIMEIIEAKQPDFILLENVKNILTHDKGQTLKKILQAINEAGYKYIYYDIFNSRDFSLAQNRNRIYIFASRTNLGDSFKFENQLVKDSFNSVKEKSSLVKHEYAFEILEKNVDKKYYLSEIIKPTILSNGSKNFKSKSEIDQLIARPLTATMAKMHRACQDNYFSDDYIRATNPIEYSSRQFSKEELAKKSIRRITPKEAFNLQGFNDNFYLNAKKAKTSDSQLYKQAGNAVSVNTVYAILHYLFVKMKILGD